MLRQRVLPVPCTCSRRTCGLSGHCSRLAPDLAKALAEQGLPAKARAEGEQIFIDYESFGEGTGYVRPSVLLEFGARSTG